ncbi:MAG TPA: hypothetical protein VM347_29275 [Nonomuraea sp.]|nr:hypothetical protein [Nonomuraea sp.]
MGEYSKTYVMARQDYGDIMDALRNGRIFVTTGDLITALDVTAGNQGRQATVGETLTVSSRNRTDVGVEIRFRPSDGENGNGDRPEVRRIDLIVGQVTGVSANLDTDTNPTTKVVARFGERDWRRQGQDCVIKYTLRDVGTDSYIRVRGTGTDEMEPLADGKESPWEDLWFYSNPVFVRVR